MSVDITSDGKVVNAVDTDDKVSLEYEKGQGYVVVVGNGVGVQVNLDLLNEFLEKCRDDGVLELAFVDDLEKESYNSGHEDGHQDGWDERDAESNGEDD